MAKFKKGDKVVYDDKEYVVSSYDEINEEWVISDGKEEISADETVLLSKEDYEEIMSKVEDTETSHEDETTEKEEEVVHKEETAPKKKASLSESQLKKKRSFKEDEEFVSEEAGATAAAETIKTKPSAATDSSKSQMMSSVITTMSGMGKGDMIDFFNKMMAQIGHEADSIPGGAASSNKGTIAAKPSSASAVQKEDFQEIIADIDLTEEVKEKLSTLFESAVHLRVTEIEKDLVEAYEKQLEEKTEEISEELSDKVDTYLSRVADKWLEENKVAIESNLRTEFTDSFLDGLRNLFSEHYVDIPEGKVDVVEELASKVQELEKSLNEQVEANLALVESIEEYNAEEIFNEISEGLAMNQVEQLRTLAEGIEYSGDDEEYKRKLKTIKEAHFKVKAPESTLHEEVDIEDNKEKKSNSNIDPKVASYASAIKRTVKR